MDENELKILVAGDVFPVASNEEYFIAGDTEALFGEKIIKLFKDADYSVCNTEGCIADEKDQISKVGPVVTAGSKTLLALKRLGVRAVTLGNTHMMDGGVTGYFDYISHLEESGIDYFGCGSDTDHMKNYILVEQKGIRVILYNVMEFFFNGATEKGPGGNLYDETRVLEELRELRKNCDHLVVLYHGGFESTFYNTPLIRTRFHRMADAGADILISQHTHAIGNEEEYHGSLLIYGQGNFCFNLAKKVNDCMLRGMLLNFIFTKEGYRVERHVVRRTEIGCVYDEEQDLSEQRERTKMHDRLLAGDPEAENVFLQENRKVSKVFIERLLKGFYGAIELPPFSEKQIRILLLMLQAEEMNEMAVCYFTELLEKYEKESE